MMYGYYSNWGMPMFGGLIMFIFWFAVIYFIVWLIRKGGLHSNHECMSGKNNNALDILKERYAKGEINKEEFETKKKDLA